MNRIRLPAAAVVSVIVALVCGIDFPVHAQGGNALYPRMAPLAKYLMPERRAEVVLAQSAAPKAISAHASVLVLGGHVYETAIRGSNGFTCLVERAWMSPFDSPEFWNPKMRGPICYNPPASRSILLYTFERTKLAMEGLTKAQMLDRITAVFAKHELPMPEVGSMSYMMSKHGDLGDANGPWRPHLMFHLPKADGVKSGAIWGADLPGSPIVTSNYTVTPEPETIFMIPVGNWSDGSAAPSAM